MRRRIILLIAFISVALLFGIRPLAQGDGLQIVATHGILADVARNVAGEHAQISSLIPVGADQHGFIPTPRDLTTVAEAELVFINGAGFEEGLLDAVESAGEEGNIVNASACIEIRPFGAGMGHDDHDDEHSEDQRDDDMAGESACDDYDAEFAAIVGEEERRSCALRHA